MKKWMYVISVGSMLAIFLVFYFSETKKHEQRERERIVAAKVAADAKAAEKARIEATARADAEKRAKDRADAEAKKEADRLAKWEAVGKEIQDATNKYNADADRSAKKAAALELELSTLRANKEKLNRETFELARQVELGKISRRTAEIEIQRYTQMVSNAAAKSLMAKSPVVAPTSP